MMRPMYSAPLSAPGMVSFTRAAVIASVFVILGAVIQGSGASDTLGRLGSVNAMGGAFTVALAAGLTVYFMTRAGLPVSTTQAIVGAIIGWNFFTDNAVDTRALIADCHRHGSPDRLLGALFAYGLYHLVKISRKRIKVHLLQYESISQDRADDRRCLRRLQPRGKQHCKRDGGLRAQHPPG
ncbi:MAG: inorganic phosphate transporter [Marinilabiliales bacterium]|nr:inorganic phosphate transporter [Marinilabiliales bacterium]